MKMMDQVLPGYAEECHIMHSDNSPNMLGYPVDLNHHYVSIKHEHISFPGDHDNVSLYFGNNQNEDVTDKFHMGLEEGERRKIRRERNKVAASKCRNKRKEHVRYLIKESDALEHKNIDLKDEISHLQAEIKELESMLDSHRCNMKNETASP